LELINLNINLTQTEWALHCLVFVVNLILFFVARPIVTWAAGGSDNLFDGLLFI
jgi:hypothetical protein